MTAVVRSMTRDDLDRVVEIEANARPTPWTRARLETELGTAHARCLVAEVSGEVHGFVVAWTVAAETEVHEIAVAAGHRRRGLGLLLLNAAAGDGEVLLEVREDNVAAAALYDAAGFTQVGRRRGYYGDGKDALLLRRELRSGASE